MKATHNRRLPFSLACLVIVSTAAFLMASGPHLSAAQEADTSRPEGAGKTAVEIEIGDEGVTVRAAPHEQKAKISKKIIIGEEGIILNDKMIDADKLADSVMQCIAEGGSIVKFGEDVTIEENECVDGDLVAVGGDITVRGLVTGDVAAIGGNLYLKSTGVIKGDVATVGGKLHQEPGSEIRGQRVGVGPVIPIHIGTKFPVLYFTHPIHSFLSFGIPLIFFIVLSLILVALVVFFAPRNVERVKEAVEKAPLKSVLLGFLAVILWLPLFIVLCITIIGIPVALIAQPIAYFVASIMGFAGVSLFVGTKLDRSSGLTLSTPFAKIIVGALVIELAFILALILTLGGRFLAPLFWLLHIIGWIIFSVAAMAGLGATIWTRFGRRSVSLAPAGAQEAPTPTPPENAAGPETPETPLSG